jgi:hypothetical protein
MTLASLFLCRSCLLQDLSISYRAAPKPLSGIFSMLLLLHVMSSSISPTTMRVFSLIDIRIGLHGSLLHKYQSS